jgi:hypothetical protein
MPFRNEIYSVQHAKYRVLKSRNFEVKIVNLLSINKFDYIETWLFYKVGLKRVLGKNVGLSLFKLNPSIMADRNGRAKFTL